MKEDTYCRKCQFLKIKDDYYDYSECPGSKPGAIRFMDESLENNYQCPYYQSQLPSPKRKGLSSDDGRKS